MQAPIKTWTCKPELDDGCEMNAQTFLHHELRSLQVDASTTRVVSNTGTVTTKDGQ